MIEDRAIKAVDKAISELVNFDLVVVENSNAPPSTYVQRHRHEYIRTVRDVLSAMPPRRRVAKFVCWRSGLFLA